MDRPDYKAEEYAEEGKGMVTRSMAARKEQGQEKSSGIFNTMKSAVNSATASIKIFLGSNENNEDEIKEEPTGPAEEEDEQITEVQFASLMESISEDEIVVR